MKLRNLILKHHYNDRFFVIRMQHHSRNSRGGNTLIAGPCADLTIGEAFFLHEEAKNGFAKYLNTREDHLLFDAFIQLVIQDRLLSL